MQKLIDKIIYKSLTVSEFLDIMKPYHYPFDLSTSYIADFFITNGSSLEETYIVMCIPTCYDVAENLLKKNAPNILRDIDKGTNLGKILKGLNYRDILIESFNLIYVNPWELHTVIEIGESQRMALLSLEKFGYINPNVYHNDKIIYHKLLMSTLESDGYAIRKNIKPQGSKISSPVYYVKYEKLSKDVKARVNAFISYNATYDKVIDDKENSFWRFDTSYNVIDYISQDDVDKFI